MGDFEIIDLFAGPGGLDMAAHSLGIPATGIELDREACETRNAFAESQRDRGPSMTTVHGNVRNADPRDFGSANVLAAGPPCQTFSVAGTGTGRRNLDQVYSYIDRMAAGEDVTGELADLDDPRTGLVLEPLKWVLARENENPFQVVVLEQVPAVLPVWQKMADVLGKLGFEADAHILNAEEYGVPQTRRRAILIARKGTAVEFPAHTHQRYRKDHESVPVEDHPKGLHPWNSMGSVLRHRGEFTVVSNYGTGGDPKNRGLRRHLDPAFTVTGKIGRNRLVGPDGKDQERLTTSEAGSLQTFPRHYPWRGKNVQQQVGNAIPPLLAAHVLIAALGLPKKNVGSILEYDGFLVLTPIAFTTPRSSLLGPAFHNVERNRRRSRATGRTQSYR
ncbi:DNA cytosine methyltransferase [Glycomyces tritici]|uniref:DNA (cytosine-5-)-methyltransferase n=1 Tax=Glycomyces tritici TaxID=2665176 RepID=A0ABT7YJ74_9ACTN|nr:DNA cytosine methyltransferase [Glycomyces tritici]MDN3238678.1 DNA cytosine methyltransferase [Glycomyces tritici]